jgi:predicted nucleic acid-binding protein
VTTPTASKLVLVDSSGWIEYFGEGQKAHLFAPYLEREDANIVPTIVVYEVFKKLTTSGNRAVADRFLSYAFRTRFVVLDVNLALTGVKMSLDHGLHVADSLVYATAQTFQAELVTTDQHFQGLPGVVLI